MKKALPPLHIVCGDSESTSFVEIKNGIATALNGSLIGQLNLAHYSSLDGDVIRKLNGKKIHRDIWEAVIDAEEIDVNDDVLHYTKGGVRADFDISCDFTFPDYSAPINAMINSPFDKKTFIAVSPEFIATAKRLFPDKDIIIRFYQQSDLMIMFPHDSGSPKGFLAFTPHNIDDEQATIDFSLT